MLEHNVERVITADADSVMQHLNPFALARNLWGNRNLIRQFIRREVEGRYKGSFLGLFWSFVNPLVLLLIYTFVFGIVFHAKWPHSRTNSLGEFAATIFCGLIPFTMFSECVTRSGAMIVGVPNYVKKVVFPLEILAISALGSAMFHALVSLTILLVATLLISGGFYWTLLLLPIVALPLIFLTLGLTWFISSLGVFIRDIGYTVTLVVQVLFFATAIFYPIQAIPAAFLPVIHFNPLASVVDNFRRVILWGETPVWSSLGLWILITATLMVLGYAWFMKSKKAFADVI